ncbi:hypothetical protein ACNOYE_03590 [Nannocystaceae bacterium ST9]
MRACSNIAAGVPRASLRGRAVDRLRRLSARRLPGHHARMPRASSSVLVRTPPRVPDASSWPTLADRDRRILESMLAKLSGVALVFDDAARALHEAVEQLIPGGRTFFLGVGLRGPILGSIVSGVGITPGPSVVVLVRIDRAGRPLALGDLSLGNLRG